MLDEIALGLAGFLKLGGDRRTLPYFEGPCQRSPLVTIALYGLEVKLLGWRVGFRTEKVQRGWIVEKVVEFSWPASLAKEGQSIDEA
ncbi:MAG TPA: hypothetical protein VN345_17140 [Blastocatellia bacterium]|nr:hypothetical protein [Blastocatellia bacterium]